MSPRPRIVAALTALAMTAAACSSAGGTAEIGSGTAPDAAPTLFDSAVVHAIEVAYEQADYDAVIAAFADSGEKQWIEATVTIDGVTYEQVGLRLKGNSSLSGLRGDASGGGMRRPGAGEEAPAPEEDPGATTDAPGAATEPARPPGAPRGGGGPGGFGSASAEEPEQLPWLIRLDEFVQGQDHQGYEDVVIRSNASATSLNEAVALDLLDAAGLASQEAAATSFRVNEGDPVLRLAVEHPDDDAWQDANFQGDGALYKAESTGDWSYRGDDPAAYEEVFDQEGGSGSTDLSPLIDFLQFLDESDDATFATELPERLDVESFATYLAMMDLIENADDIDGPGNNAYLWYDIEDQRFTIVPWDMNLAFGGLGRGGAGGGPPAGFRPPAGGQLPQGVQPPGGFRRPEGSQPPADGGPEGGRRGPVGRSNVLVDRFHAVPEFEALYQGQLTALRASLYESGEADEILDAWVSTLTDGASTLVEATTITEEANEIAQRFAVG